MGSVQMEESLPLKNDQIDEATTLACKLAGVSEEDVKKYGFKED